MSRPIRISPKHGVNPCISVCMFCGKDKGEIALFGKIGKDDLEAPRRAVLDYEPCDECKAAMSKGVAIIGVTTAPNNPGQPPIQENDGTPLYPTGNMVVMSPDGVRRMFANHPMIDHIIAHKKTFADDAIVRHILDQHQVMSGQNQTPENTDA